MKNKHTLHEMISASATTLRLKLLLRGLRPGQVKPLLISLILFLHLLTPVAHASSRGLIVPRIGRVPQGDMSSVIGSGQALVGSGTALPHEAKGPISSDVPGPNREEQEQSEEPYVPVPQGRVWGAIPPPTVPATEAPVNPKPQAPNDMVYQVLHDITPTEVATNQRSTIQEPSIGSMGNTLFMSANWYAARSSNGGSSFTYVNPYNTFPSINGGFCCDQIVNYARNQDMMLWALQYTKDTSSGTLRIARAVGSTAVLNNSWIYYDFNPQMFGFATGNWMDFPNLSIGSTFLYATSNVYRTSDNGFTGSVIWRISLSALAAGGSISFSYFARTDVGSLRCTEGATTTMYWAAFGNTSTMRIFRWDESSGTVLWDDVALSPFTFLNRDGVSITPDGRNWVARADFRVLGASVAGGVIAFMWGAKQDATFPQPYTIVGRFSQSTRALITQQPIWSSGFAWLYMNASVNSAGNQAGLIAYGGGSFYPNSAFWVNDDVQSGFVPLNSYTAAQSTAGPTSNTWGDFLTVRPHKDFPNSWVVATYYMTTGGGNTNTVGRYIWAGRERDLTGCSFTAGQGASGSELTAFQNAYNNTGGQAALGCPNQAVQFNGFTSFAGTIGHYQLCANGDLEYLTNGSRAGQAYGVVNPLFTKWASFGFNSSNPLGYPIANLSPQSTSCFSTNLKFQQFEGGALEWHLSGSRAGSVYEVHGAIYTKWGQKGFAGCPLGLPISDERAAQASGATGQTGRVSDFEGGHIHWRTGAASAFETHGSIDSLYVSMAGTASFLGFPLSDEYIAPTGRARNDFEGGFITTTDGVNYRAFRYTSTLTIGSSNPNSSVSITVSPNDNSGQGSGVTQFSRTYDTLTTVTLTAPSTASGNNFSKWQRDGVDLTTSLTANVTMDANHTMTAVYGTISRTQFDFDGDGKTDTAVWHPGDGTWYIITSSNGSTRVVQWGASGQPLNIPVARDYDGDGNADIAVWHPGDGTWYIINSSNGSTRVVQWGASGQPFNVPVPADYDGDGKTDIAVWHPGDGTWYIINSSNGSTRIVQWGASGQPFNIPVPADYDGDGKADIAVWHPGDGTWFIINSSNGSTRIVQWGASGQPFNIPVPGDYDGDGKADIAVWNPGSGFWYIINSSNGSTTTMRWGSSPPPFSTPVPADYDGDGKTDIAVWHPGDGTWYIVNSSNGSTRIVQWGASGLPYNIPVPGR